MAFDIRCNIDISENENMHYRHTNIKWRESLHDDFRRGIIGRLADF